MKTVRAFLAVPVDEKIVAAAQLVQRELAQRLPEVHWVAPQTMHLTLKPGVDLKPDIERLADMKVNAISLSTSQPHMEEKLHELRNLVAVRQIELVWDLPVPYSQFNPIALELEKDEMAASEEYTDLYVEPDGDVLPAQGINRVMGNMLSDDWDKIWSARLETTA